MNYSRTEIKLLNKYTDYNYARVLNETIRNNLLTNEQRDSVDHIVQSINKNTIDEETLVYKGISVDYKTYVNNFLKPYLKNEIII